MKNKKTINFFKKNYLLLGIIFLILIILAFFVFNGLNGNKEYNFDEFNQCLADNGLVVYGSEWCPACRSLIETLGGYKSASPVYVECTENQARCQQETKTGYIPEIQINGEVYQGARTLEELGRATSCQIPN